MKKYESLFVEIQRFGAQDIITASVAATCTCPEACFTFQGQDPDGTTHWLFNHPAGGCTCSASEMEHIPAQLR